MCSCSILGNQNIDSEAVKCVGSADSDTPTSQLLTVRKHYNLLLVVRACRCVRIILTNSSAVVLEYFVYAVISSDGRAVGYLQVS